MSKYDITFTFGGRELAIKQMPRDRAADGQDNTGWCVWEASAVALRYIERATGVATDVPVQLPQLEYNLECNGLRDRVVVERLYWGEPLPRSIHNLDVTIASDILFIALRDAREKELTATLVDVAQQCRAIIFVFEERLCRQEEAYMQSLGLSGEGPLLVEELKDKDVEVTFENRLQGAGGHADTDLWNPSLFWEPPPIRMFTLRSKRGISSSGADDSAVDAHASATALPAGATGE